MEMKIAMFWKTNIPYSVAEVYRRPTGSCHFRRGCDCHHRHHHHHHHQHIHAIICMEMVIVGF